LRLLIPQVTKLGNERRLSDALKLAIQFKQHSDNDEELRRIFALVERTSANLSIPTRAEVLGTMSLSVALLDSARALSIADDAVQLAESVAEPRLLIRSLSCRGSVKTITGAISGALEDFDRAESVSSDEGLEHAMFLTYANRACILFDQGHAVEARKYNRRAMACGSRHHLIPCLNEACGYLNADDYENGMVWANRTLIENQLFKAPWINLVAKSLRGLSLLGQHKYVEANEERQQMQELLQDHRLQTTDWSYVTIFLSGMDLLDGNMILARQRLHSAIEKQRYNAPFGKCRMEVALARLLMSSDPDLAYHFARSSLTRSKSLGGITLTEQAQRILDEIRAIAP
jgi:tetratricopeptide (TPR) repeat protein